MMSRSSFFLVLILPVLFCVSCVTSPDNEPGYSGSTILPVEAQFSYTYQQPLKVVLTNQSKNASSYSWDFGDGETSTKANPTHRYASKGVYKITLTASNKNYTEKAYATVQVENPTKIYISGFEIQKIPYENQYYYVKVIDDDFFTTTWVQTNYHLLSNANLPKTITLSTPKLLNGLSEDDYYCYQLFYNTKSSGNGTQVASFKMTTSQILKYPTKLTGSNDDVILITYFAYK